MKLIVQPNDGIAPVLSAIKAAKKSVEIVIFRFDRREIETVLKLAVERRVHVHALIASANRGGEQNLRRIEMRFLEAGMTVARTAGDLIRYHDKFLLIDRRVLYVLSFNYTALDIDHSRGFGIVTKNRKFLQEAIKLFEADTRRRPYTPGFNQFIVSPLNARKELGAFLRKARKQLLIYDPKISDPEMLKILHERAKAGVEIKIIGRLGKNPNGLHSEKLTKMRLHTRTIIRDGAQAFIGSQSLRKAELDSRREVGVIVREQKVIRGLIETFKADWATTEGGVSKDAAATPMAAANEAALKKTVKVISKELPPIASTVKKALKKIVAKAGPEVLADGKVKNVMKKVVKKAVKQALNEIVEQSDAAS